MEQLQPGSGLEPFNEAGMPGSNMSHAESTETLYYEMQNGSHAFNQVSLFTGLTCSLYNRFCISLYEKALVPDLDMGKKKSTS